MKLTHISLELENPFLTQEKRFVPRVPKRRLLKEDGKTKRICFSTVLDKCMEAFPDKNKLIVANRGKPVFVSVYEYETKEKDNIKTPKEIIDTVLDAELNQEYWLLNEVKIPYQLKRLKKVGFDVFNRHTGDISGLKDIITENEIEVFERIEKATFFNRKRMKRFKKTCQLLGVEILEEKTERTHKEYFGIIDSTRVYSKTELTYKIPSGVNARLLWYLVSEEVREQEKDYLVIEKEDFSL